MPKATQLPRGLPREAYFWPKVNKNGPVPPARPDLGPCWLWTAHRNKKDYGMFANGSGGSLPAHRYSYGLLVGPIPAGLQLDHLCRVHACVNPSHLEPVTQTENQLRGETFATRNAAKTHCVNGHELVPGNSYGWKGRRQCKICARARAVAYGRREDVKERRRIARAQAKA